MDDLPNVTHMGADEELQESERPSNLEDVQEVDSYRTHVTETQLPGSSCPEHLHEEETWKEPQPNIASPIAQPGNKIARPVIDETPHYEGFRFENFKGPAKRPLNCAEPSRGESNLIVVASSWLSEKVGSKNFQRAGSTWSQVGNATTKNTMPPPPPKRMEITSSNPANTALAVAGCSDRYYVAQEPFQTPDKSRNEEHREPTDRPLSNGHVEISAKSSAAKVLDFDGDGTTPRPSIDTLLAKHPEEVHGIAPPSCRFTESTSSPMPKPVVCNNRSNNAQTLSDPQPQALPVYDKVRQQSRAASVNSSTTSSHNVDAMKSAKQDKVLSSEQLFKMFMFRRSKEEEQRQNSEAKLHEKTSALKRMSTELTSLQDSLLQARQLADSKQNELQEYRQRFVKLKDKAGKLQKFVNGLTRDQQKLGSDATTLQAHLQGALEAKNELESTVAEERRDHEDMIKAKTTSFLKARAHIIELEERVQQQDQDLENLNELLDYERHRNDGFEQDLSAISAQQTRMLQNAETNQSLLMDRLGTLPLMANFEQMITQAVRPLDNGHALQELARSLDELKATPNISTDGLKRLSAELNTCAKRIIDRFEGQESEIRTLHDQHKEDLGTIESTVKNLSASLERRDDLSESISRLRGDKDAVEERLRQKETELAIAIHRCSDLEMQNRRNCNDVHVLNEQLASLRARPEPDRTLPERLREAERKHRESEAEVARLQQVFDRRQDEIQKLENNSADLQLQLEGLKSQLEQSQTSVATLHSEKQKATEAADTTFAIMRAELAKATESEKLALKKKHTAELCEITCHKVKAEADVKSLQTQIATLKKALETSASTNADRNSQLEATRRESDDFKRTIETQKKNLEQLESAWKLSRERSDANADRCSDLTLRVSSAEKANAEMKQEKAAMEKEINLLKSQLSKTESQAYRCTDQPKILPAIAESGKLRTDGPSDIMLQQDQAITQQSSLELLHASTQDYDADWDETQDFAAVPLNQARQESPELPYEGRKSPEETHHHHTLRPENASSDPSIQKMPDDVELVPAPDDEIITSPHFQANKAQSASRDSTTQNKDSVTGKEQEAGVNQESIWKVAANRGDSPQSHRNGRFVRFNDGTEPAKATCPTPAPLSSSPSSKQCSRDPEIRSNFSVRRVPAEGSQTAAPVPRTNILQESSFGQNLKLVNLPYRSPDPGKSLPAEKENLNGKRKRGNDEAPVEDERSSKPKQNRFSRATQGTAQATMGQTLKQATGAIDGGNRRMKSRVSQGEVRGLGPIIGGPQSPTKSITGSQGNTRRKKSLRRGQDKFSKKFNDSIQEK